MPDIKVREKVKGTIKTLDKGVVQAQKFKNNIVTTKERTNEITAQKYDSVNDYTNDRVQSNISYIKNKGINKFNNYGKKATQNTYKNIKRAREKIIKSKIKNKGIKQSIKTPKNTTKLTKKSIKTTQKAMKHTAKATKETIKATQKAVKVAKESAVKTAQAIKATVKAIVTTVKAIIAATKALVAAIVAGGWVAVIIIVVIVLIAGIVAAIYNIGNDENFDMSFITSNEIVLIAKGQVGNVGGEPYWKWYGFEERVEWCACFVSWCANECGFIDRGIIPKFSGCIDGVEWFQKREQWHDRSDTYFPMTRRYYIF